MMSCGNDNTFDRPFSLLGNLPIELTERIFAQFLSGKSLSTLAIALHCCSCSIMDRNNKHNHDDNDDDDDDENYREQNNPKQLKSSSDDADKLHFNMLLKLIHQVSKGRLLETASFIESMAPVESSNGSNPKIDTLTVHAVNWIRSVVEFSFVDETSPLAFMRVLSENLALMDFLELSIQAYSDAKQGAFEWPVWVGQISVDSYVTGSRMRNTAHVVVTTPMQSPGFLPGCNLIQKRTPSGIFRCEPYNMIPIPPWGRLRALSREDAQILRPVAERLEHQSQVAVPLGYHSDEILDIRVASAARTRQLLASMSWKPRGSWILEDLPDHSSADAVSWSTGLVCVWQEDTMEMRSDRQYLTYVVDLLKAMDRMQQLK